MENKNIKLFNEWAISGKDVSMEKGHTPSVNYMIEIIKNKPIINQRDFKFLDLGCGNGWVVRKLAKHKLCNLAVGVDGARNMINNAISYSKNEIYINANIENWEYPKKFDIIFSMETFYYIKNVTGMLKNIYNNLLNENGSIIIGIDHYYENKPSLSWDKDYDLNLLTLTVNQWKKMFEKNQFKNIEIDFFGKKDNWNGTLILYAEK